MSITYQCKRCGKWYTVRESKVGSKATCKDCGQEMIVPDAPDLFNDYVDGPSGGAAVPRQTVTRPQETRALPEPRPMNPGNAPGKLWGGGLGVMGFILLVILKIAIRMPFNGNGRPVRPPQIARPVQQPQNPFQLPRQGPIERPAPVDLSKPINVPKDFPEIGPAREIEPGVFLHEIRLRSNEIGQAIPPGHVSTLWLYLPAAKGRFEPRSLPCVLIAPAGTNNALTGMRLAPSDRPEHIPYVKAGFAVLAFDLDGGDVNPRRGTAPWQNMSAFLRSRAGLVNGRIAIEFLKAKVPAVDPGRLYVAGHSSAATFALLLAEHEPSLKGCVAYAPIVDLAEQMKKLGLSPMLDRTGFTELMTLFSPRVRESDLNCPLFLFVSRDDETIDVEQATAFAARLKAIGKTVTLDRVDIGGHYQSMIDVGIPHGLKWLENRDAEVKARH